MLPLSSSTVPTHITRDDQQRINADNPRRVESHKFLIANIGHFLLTRREETFLSFCKFETEFCDPDRRRRIAVVVMMRLRKR